MKKIFATSVALASLTLSTFLAMSPAMSHAGEARLLANVSHVSPEVARITLDENGLLTVFPRQTRDPLRKQLSPGTTEQLTSLAYGLAAVRTRTEFRKTLCEIVYDPRFLPKLAISELNGEGEPESLKLVLVTGNCATPEVTYPRDRQAFGRAHALLEALLSLSNELTHHGE
jgi:hypothetical protein